MYWSVNLGTPDSPSYFAVQRYLRDFLGDRRVIDTSRWIWLPLLYGVVLPFRPLRTVRKYRKIWMPDGSPLAVYSTRLTDKIGERLQAALGDRVRVALGMTYGNPSIASAITLLAEQNVKRLLVLPLYPQYCSSTTGSVFDRTSRALRRWRWLPETRFVNDYYDDPGYIDALAARIEEHWAEAGGALASAVLLPRHSRELRAARAIRIRRRPRRPPGWWCRGSGWQRRSGRIAISRASARWSGCSRTRRIRSRQLAEARAAQIDRRVAVVRGRLPRDAGGGGDRISRQVSSSSAASA